MQGVQQAFGPQVQFFDNANCLVQVVIDPIRTEATGQQMEFNLYGRPQQSKHRTNLPPLISGVRQSTKYIIHRVRTAYPISDLKADPRVLKMLKDHDFYVKEHRWSERDWDILQIGFMFGIDPTFYDIDQATAKIKLRLTRMLRPEPKFLSLNSSMPALKWQVVGAM